MSAIHQALQKATSSPSEPLNKNDYNPLASNAMRPATKKPRASFFYWLLAGAFLVLIPVVIFWPTTSSLTVAKQENAVAQPTTEISTPVEEEPAAQSTPLAKQSSNKVTSELPESNTTLQVENIAEGNVGLITDMDAETNPVIETEAKAEIAEPVAKAVTEVTAPVVVAKPKPVAEKAVEPKTIDVVTVSAQHWQSKVEQHLADGNIEHAESVLKQWIGSSPQDEAPRVWLARIYLSNQLYNPAESLLVQLESNEALALKGVLYEKTQRFGLASAQFSELFNREPDTGRWLLMWAVNTENSGNSARSLDLYQAFIKNFHYEDESLTTFAQQRIRVLEGK